MKESWLIYSRLFIILFLKESCVIAGKLESNSNISTESKWVTISSLTSLATDDVSTIATAVHTDDVYTNFKNEEDTTFDDTFLSSSYPMSPSTLTASMTRNLHTLIQQSRSTSPISSVFSTSRSSDGNVDVDYSLTLHLQWAIIAALGLALLLTTCTCIIMLACRSNEKKDYRPSRKHLGNYSDCENQTIESIDLALSSPQRTREPPPTHCVTVQELGIIKWQGNSRLLGQPTGTSTNS